MSCPETDVDHGTAPTVQGTFRNSQGALVNPPTVQVVTQDPTGAQVSYADTDTEVSLVSTGVWAFTFPAAMTIPGKWWVKFIGSGSATVASEMIVNVSRPRVAVAP
jgi:hypothetical protein